MIHEAVAAVLHSLEGLSEREVFAAYGVAGDDLEAVLEETGTPAGWHPLAAGYDALPSLPESVSVPSELLARALADHPRLELSPADLSRLKTRLRTLYEAGRGASVEEPEETETGQNSEENEAAEVVGALIPIPAETFLEELSQKLEVHPISIYWLLEEIRKDGARCLPGERDRLRDRMTVLVLRLFGHRWPKDVETGEPVPPWAESDGIIPLVEGTGETSLLDRVRARLAEEMGDREAHFFERGFEEVIGTPLGEWLRREFFSEHARQFKKRPIAWVLESGHAGANNTSRRRRLKVASVSPSGGGFACMIYYHALDKDLLAKVRTRYLRPVFQRREFELGEARKRAAASEVVARAEAERIERILDELKAFETSLLEVETKGYWCAGLEAVAKTEPLDHFTARREGASPPPGSEVFLRQEQAFDPDLNDGVRVNIAPLQRAGLLASEVLPPKDVERAIADRARWRADERRWCREGKLPKPGWWLYHESAPLTGTNTR